MTDAASYWDAVYATKGDDVSWYETEPATSLALVAALPLDHGDAVVDVGGGASWLACALVTRGFRDVTVVDVSGQALALARGRCPSGDDIRWVRADVTAWVPERTYALWHDRAVFHFLVDEPARAAYLAALDAGTAPGSYAILATFAPDGPDTCSGLPVHRYDATELIAALGPSWRAVDTRRVVHRTPWGGEQPFTWLVARRADAMARTHPS